MNHRFRLTMKRKKSILGIVFIAPWFLGFIILMVVPLAKSIQIGFSKLELHDSGYSLQYVGWDNFRAAFLSDSFFSRLLTESVIEMFLNVPIIIFFSLFTALMLSQKFRGRALARAIVFLPVVLSSGVIAAIDSGEYVSNIIMQAVADAEGNFGGANGLELRSFLLEAGMSRSIVEYLTEAVDRIYTIISQSGVQILIFLAGLQSISPSHYETARIEGATGYESFWKITFPMMTPFILTNTVYSIVDSFYNNSVTKYIHTMSFQQLRFGLGAAMSWTYFAVIAIILVGSAYLISRKTYYAEKAA